MHTEAVNEPPIREAVRILVDRMEAFPDEFMDGGKFFWVSNMLLRGEDIRMQSLTAYETTALHTQYKKVIYHELHTRVMQSLVADEYQSPHINQNKYGVGIRNSSLLGGTNGISTNTFTTATNPYPSSY